MALDCSRGKQIFLARQKIFSKFSAYIVVWDKMIFTFFHI